MKNESSTFYKCTATFQTHCSIAGLHIIRSVVPGSTVHDSVAEACVFHYQRSPIRSKGQCETAKSSALPNHTFTRTCNTISKTVGNFGTMFCYLKKRKTVYAIEMADVRVFAGRNPGMIPPLPFLSCQELRKVQK
jgi:DMSO reductase anchor subunit